MTTQTPAEEIADLDNETSIEVAAAMADPDRPWRIEDDRTAIWAARKWRGAVDRIAEVTAEAEAQHALVDQWVEARTRGDRDKAAWFEGHLKGYALRLRDEAERAGGKVRASIPLVGAVVSTRSSNPVVVIDDEDKLAYQLLAEKHSDLVAVAYKPKLTEFRKAAVIVRRAVHSETGEVVEWDGKTKKWPPADFAEIAPIIRFDGRELTEFVSISERKVTASLKATDPKPNQTTEGPEE